MSPHPLRRPAHVLAVLRRWLRHTWVSRVPILEWWRRLTSAVARRGPASDSPRPRVQLDLQPLETRMSPDDPIGLGLMVLGMPLVTPMGVFLHGWAGGRLSGGNPDAAGPAAPFGAGGELLSLVDGRLFAAAATLLAPAPEPPGGDTPVREAPAVSEVQPQQAAGDEDPFRNPFDDGRLEAARVASHRRPPFGGDSSAGVIGAVGNLSGPGALAGPPEGPSHSGAPAGQSGGSDLDPALAARLASLPSSPGGTTGPRKPVVSGTPTVGVPVVKQRPVPGPFPGPFDGGSGLIEYPVCNLCSSGPLAITSGPDGQLWFTLFGDPAPGSSVASISTGGAVSGRYPLQYPNDLPNGYSITVGPDKNVYFTVQRVDTDYHDELYKASLPGGPAGNFYQANGLAAGGGFLGVTTGPDNNLWFTNTKIYRLSLSNPASPTVYNLPDGSIVWQIASGPDNALWFTNYGLNQIGRIDTSGNVATEATGLSAPYGIVKGPDGALWFTEEGAGIGRITTSGVVTEYTTGIAPGGKPHGITVGPDGNLWFAESGTNKIGQILRGSGLVTEFGGLSGNPESITAGPDGNIWFTEPSADVVGKLSALVVRPLTVSSVEGKTFSGRVAWFTGPLGFSGGGYTATIDWGDGTAPDTVTPTADASGIFNVVGTHTYAEERPNPGTTTPTYPISITVTDGQGHVGSNVSTAEVKDAPITPNPGTRSLPTLQAGNTTGTVTLAEFIDGAGSSTDQSDLSASIDWGDGTPKVTNAPLTVVNANTFDVQGSHTYANFGSYVIQIQMTDQGGSRANATATITVQPHANPGGTAYLLGASTGVGPGVDPAFEPNGPSDGPDPTGPGPFLLPFGPDYVAPDSGGVRTSIDLDFDLSPGTGVGAHPALDYNSDTVGVKPVIRVAYASDPAGTVPASIDVILTWNGGTPQAAVHFATTGHAAGDVYLLSVQVASPVATGYYPYSVEVKANGTTLDQTLTGGTFVLSNDNSPFGAGWFLDGLDRLVDVSAATATGAYWAYGDGGTRFFSLSGGSFTSPADDFGTLTQTTSGTFTYYTYTAKDQTKKYFDGGDANHVHRLTRVVEPHGLTLTYSYDGSGRLTSVLSPDGGTATLSYASGALSVVQEPGGRSLSFTPDGSANLTAVTDAAGAGRAFQYDGSHRLTNDQWAPFNTTFTYNGTYGYLTAIDRGLGTVYALTPRRAQGLYVNSTTPAPNFNNDVAVLTDPLTYTTTYTVYSRLTKEQTPDGATQVWDRNGGGLVRTSIDGNGNNTFWSYTPTVTGQQNPYDLTGVGYPAGGLWTYQYDPTYHKLTSSQNSAGQTVTSAYDSATGDLTSATDGAGGITTYTYYQSGGRSTGQVSTVADGLNHPSSYTYDANRRRQTFADPLGDTTTYLYDAAGNPSTTTDPLGHVTTTAYDARNRLTQSIAPDGGQTSYAYDAAGDRVGLTDPRNYRTTYQYDQRGWQTQVQQPEGRTTQYGYDKAGNATIVTDPNNHSSTYAFDPVGRETSRTVPLNATQSAVTGTGWDLAGNKTTVTDPLGHTTTYAYDRGNRLTGVTDPLGDTANTLYDDVGNVVVSADRDGNATLYAYDGANRLTSTTDGTTAVATTVFDKAGNVVNTIDPDGNVTTFLYDRAERKTATLDALKNTTTLVYDKASRVTNVIDALGHTTTFAYDNADRKTATIDALGHTTTTLYDPAGNVTKTIDGDGNPTTYAYDGLGRQTSTTNALTQVRMTKYDPVGNVTSFTEPLSHTATMTFYRTTTYVYDLADRRTNTIDPLGRTATTAYDKAGNVTYAQDFRGKETDYKYDNADRLTRASDPDGKVTTTSYDKAGNVTKVQDPLGGYTYTGYDGANRPVAASDLDGNQSLTFYDGAGNTTVAVDFRGDPTYYGYDALNRRTATTDAQGSSTRVVFDPAGRQTNAIDPLGSVTTFSYDIADRRTTVRDPLNQLTTLAYDNANNLTLITDPAGKFTTYLYDALNRVTSTIDPDGHRTTTAFDDAGRAVAATDALNHTTTYGFDAADRQTAVTDPRGATTTTLYDAADNVTSVTDPNHWTTTYQYDDDNLKTAAIDPQGNTFTYSYDGDSRLTKTTDRLGRVVTYAYDPDGRLTGQTWKAVGGATADVLTFTYDGEGNALTAANRLGTYSYAYDGDNRLTASTDPFGLTLTYTYDGAGNRTLAQDSLGGTTTSVYDPLRRLVSRQFSDSTAQLRFDPAWTPRGELASLQRFQDAAGTQQAGITSYTYDPVSGLVKTVTPYGGGTPGSPYSGTVLASYAYGYDPVNRLLTQRDNGGPAVTYQYDNASEVTSDAAASYAWDAAGNRTNAGFSQGADKGDQLQTDGTWTYTYDAEGNLAQKSKGPSAETWVYTYDDADHLLSAEDRPTPTGAASIHIDYAYDALGQLVRRAVTTGGTTTTTVYAQDGSGNAWADLDGGGTLQTRHFFTDRTDEVVAKADYGGGLATVTWYLEDRQGSARALMTNGGALAGGQSFDAFGNPQGTPLADPYGYAGGWRDPATGLVHFGERWYSPATDSWTSRDPIEFGGGQANLYQYVGNDPTNLTDPSGLDGFSIGGYTITINWNKIDSDLDAAFGAKRSGWFDKWADVQYGWADTLSFRLTDLYREGLFGLPRYNNMGYYYGGVGVGTVHNAFMGNEWGAVFGGGMLAEGYGEYSQQNPTGPLAVSDPEAAKWIQVGGLAVQAYAGARGLAGPAGYVSGAVPGGGAALTGLGGSHRCRFFLRFCGVLSSGNIIGQGSG